MSRTELAINTDVLMEWLNARGPHKDPVTLLAVETGMSSVTAWKIIKKGYVPGPTIRANVSMVTGIPVNTLWRPKAA